MEIILEIARVFWGEIVRMWWFVLLGIVVGGLIKTFKLDRQLYRLFNDREPLMVILGTAIGIFSPLCSCGILPVVVTLAECGLPLGPVLAILIASPIMSIEALIITNFDLGLPFAEAKLLGAAAMGLSCGYAAMYAVRWGLIPAQYLKITDVISSCLLKRDDILAAKQGEIPVNYDLAEHKLVFFLKRTKELALFVGKYVLLALFIEAVIKVLVPEQAVVALVGDESAFSPIVATLMGVPIPANGISVVPILSGLVDKGMGFAAAISFLIAAPVTSIPAITALLGMFHRRVLYLFLFISLIGPPILGYLLSAIIQN